MNISAAFDALSQAKTLREIDKEKTRIVSVLIHQISTCNRERIFVTCPAEQVSILKSWCGEIGLPTNDGSDPTHFWIVL
jgi:hypothetical protein